MSLQKDLARCSVGSEYSNTLTEELDLCKKELEYIIQWRTQGAILRCKARWYNEGEKNTKYFLNLETERGIVSLTLLVSSKLMRMSLSPLILKFSLSVKLSTKLFTHLKETQSHQITNSFNSRMTHPRMKMTELSCEL